MGHFWNACPETCLAEILTRSPKHPKLVPFNAEEQWPYPIPAARPSRPSKKTHFGILYSQPHSCDHRWGLEHRSTRQPLLAATDRSAPSVKSSPLVNETLKYLNSSSWSRKNQSKTKVVSPALFQTSQKGVIRTNYTYPVHMKTLMKTTNPNALAKY